MCIEKVEHTFKIDGRSTFSLRSTTDSSIVVVDQFTGFDAKVDTYDGIHPGSAGETKYFKNLIKPVEKALDVQKTEKMESTLHQKKQRNQN
jgi:hypothetical protein